MLDFCSFPATVEYISILGQSKINTFMKFDYYSSGLYFNSLFKCILENLAFWIWNLMIGSHVSPFKQFFRNIPGKFYFMYNYFEKRTQTIEKTFIELHLVRFCQEIIFNLLLVHCLPVKLFKLFKIYILTTLVLEKELDEALYFTHSSIKPYRTHIKGLHSSLKLYLLMNATATVS